jgi:hypothetical protein
MPDTTRSINTFLVALSLSAGLASPLALAEDESKEKEAASPVANAVEEHEVGAKQEPQQAEEHDNADYVAVRISLPDGRTFTRLESRRSMSARFSPRRGGSISTSIRTSSGARVSIPSRSVSGGSNSSSVKLGGGGGGGGGSSSSSGGGGGGGGSAADVTKDASAGLEASAPESTSGIVSFGGSGGSTSSSSGEGGGGSAAVVAKDTSAGIESSAPMSTGGIFSFGGSGADTEESSTADSNETRSNDSRPAIPTVGSPRFDREGNATGGQRVEFHDAGMSAAVIGNRVYLNNVELVVADQPFDVISGTVLGHDSAMMDFGRLGSGSADALGSFNSRNSSIKLEFESDTTVTLLMYTQSPSSLDPEREMRSWTVRVR